MVLGLLPLSDRVGEGKGEPILDFVAGEEMMLVQPDVAVALGRRLPESPGTLYISTKRVMWLSDVDKSKGYAVDFLSISLHAVSRDPEAYPSPCIYTQIETGADESADSEDSDSEGVDNVELSKITEMRLVPSDPSQLDTLFDIFCQCAELNPEPNEDGEEENSWFFGDEGMAVDGIGDSEWQFSDSLANPIGYVNGDHDLARTVLEVDFVLRILEALEIYPPSKLQGGASLSVWGYFLQFSSFFPLSKPFISTAKEEDKSFIEELLSLI